MRERENSKKAPGKNHRKGLSLVELFDKFPNEEAARTWFEQVFWPNGAQCPYCESHNVQCGIKHKTMTHRCRDCADRKMFSLKTGTVMEGSKLKYRVWAIAIYLLTTNLKGVSSMKLHRELKISQKSAWFLAHRLRETYKTAGVQFSGPVEFDETHVGWKRRNMPNKMRAQREGRGAVDMATVVGAKDRATNQVTAKVIESPNADTLQGFVCDKAEYGATVYTDGSPAYDGIANLVTGFRHEQVNHSIHEYVKGEVHTNGIESFWSMLKRAHKGTFHRLSVKHLGRYVNEFAGRHNQREFDTIVQMAAVVLGMSGKRLKFNDLIA